MTKLILKNQGTKKNNQRKKQTHRQQTHTHKHRPKGKKRTQSISIPHIVMPKKHDSKKRVTPEQSSCLCKNVPNGPPGNQLCAAMTLMT